MGRKAYEIRFFRCPGCGNTLTASKWEYGTHRGHVKTMWCPFCKADKDMKQTDKDVIRK